MSTLTNISGFPMQYPPRPRGMRLDGSLFNRASLVIDATGEKVAFMGHFWHPSGPGSYAIRKVGMPYGTVVKAGGSALTLSLQDVDLTAGPIMRPDETQDQTVAIANGSIPASNGYLLSGALSADRTISHGDLVAVVVEFDGSGRLGADSIAFTLTSNPQTDGTYQDSQIVCALKTSGAWGNAFHWPNIWFECSDGSLATFHNTLPRSDGGTTVVRSDTTPDEYALHFQVPVEMKASGMWLASYISAATSNFDIVLYSGTTALVTGSFDANSLRSTAQYNCHGVPFAALQTLSPSTDYYIAIKPGTTDANAAFVPYFDVPSNGHLVVHPFGIQGYLATRTDGGAWSTTTTRSIFAGLEIFAIHNGLKGGQYQLGVV